MTFTYYLIIFIGEDNMSDNIINELTSQGDPKVMPSTDVPGSDKPNGVEESNMSIDSIFGNSSDDGKNGTQPQTNSPKLFGSTADGSKSPEELLKQFQSGYDKATHDNTILQAKVNELSGASDFINDLYDNKDMLKAFVAEINPELVKPQSTEDYIKSNLSKEFGADYVPEEAEENKPGSKSWLYNKRANVLYTESVKGSTEVPSTVKDLRAKKAKAKEDSRILAMQEKQNIMTKFEWQEPQYNEFVNWAQKVTATEFATIWSYAKSKSQNRKGTPSLTSIPGGNPISDSAYTTQLNDMFGA